MRNALFWIGNLIYNTNSWIFSDVQIWFPMSRQGPCLQYKFLKVWCYIWYTIESQISKSILSRKNQVKMSALLVFLTSPAASSIKTCGWAEVREIPILWIPNTITAVCVYVMYCIYNPFSWCICDVGTVYITLSVGVYVMYCIYIPFSWCICDVLYI